MRGVGAGGTGWRSDRNKAQRKGAFLCPILLIQCSFPGDFKIHPYAINRIRVPVCTHAPLTILINLDYRNASVGYIKKQFRVKLSRENKCGKMKHSLFN